MESKKDSDINADTVFVFGCSDGTVKQFTTRAEINTVTFLQKHIEENVSTPVLFGKHYKNMYIINVGTMFTKNTIIVFLGLVSVLYIQSSVKIENYLELLQCLRHFQCDKRILENVIEKYIHSMSGTVFTKLKQFLQAPFFTDNEKESLTLRLAYLLTAEERNTIETVSIPYFQLSSVGDNVLCIGGINEGSNKGELPISKIKMYASVVFDKSDRHLIFALTHSNKQSVPSPIKLEISLTVYNHLTHFEVPVVSTKSIESNVVSTNHTIYPYDPNNENKQKPIRFKGTIPIKLHLSSSVYMFTIVETTQQ